MHIWPNLVLFFSQYYNKVTYTQTTKKVVWTRFQANKLTIFYLIDIKKESLLKNYTQRDSSFTSGNYSFDDIPQTTKTQNI